MLLRSCPPRLSTLTMTSGVRRTVRLINSISSCDRRSRRPGPRRAYDATSNRGLAPRSMSRFGIPLVPTELIGPEQRLDVIAKPFRHAKHCFEVFASWSRGPTTLIGCSGDLIEVPADRPELGHGTFQRLQLLLGQRCQVAKVRPHQNRNVGGRAHSASSRP